MPFEGPTPAGFKNEQATAEAVKRADFFSFRQLLAESDDREGTTLADSFWAASQQPPEQFNPRLLDAISEESGMRQRALELIAGSPEYVAYTEEKIRTAASSKELAERLRNLPGIVDRGGELYSGKVLSEMVGHMAERFAYYFQLNTIAVAAALEEPIWIDAVSYNGMLPPVELGLRSKVIELLEKDQIEQAEARRVKRFQNYEDDTIN